MGIVGVTAAGEEAILLLLVGGGIVVAVEDWVDDIAVVAIGVARRAAHPSFPRN